MPEPRSVISGVGNTLYSRKHERSAELLAIEAITEAAADAGIAPSAIDGFINYPGHLADDFFIVNFEPPRMRLRATVDLGGASAVSGLRLAAMAVLSGAARHVLLLRAIKGSSGLRKADRPSFLPGRRYRQQLEFTQGWNTPAQRYAMLCRRYQEEYGLARETLGEIALAMRAHANLNPKAQMHGRPMTMADYLAARPIAEPYHLLDCSQETDGACAVIVSAPEAGQSRGVRILAVGEGIGASAMDISNRDPFLSTGIASAAQEVWEATGLGPKDMDAAMIYDCFTFEVLHQLEDAGFAAHGEGAALVAGGNIRLGGALPVNTHGGLLSEGHMAGLNHVVEAVRQLRGEAEGRQVEKARHIAVSGWGNFGDGSFTVLEAANA
ncbi:MAG TPA: thiolase family protein [Xanthobacteraceae bacterium]|nr:thiolase family protein [Xanthobacteraceae bacterium]